MELVFMKEFSDVEKEEISRILEAVEGMEAFRSLPDGERVTLDYGSRALEVERDEMLTRVYGYGRII